MIVNLTGFSNLGRKECIDISKEGMAIGAVNRYFDTQKYGGLYIL